MVADTWCDKEVFYAIVPEAEPQVSLTVPPAGER